MIGSPFDSLPGKKAVPEFESSCNFKQKALGEVKDHAAKHGNLTHTHIYIYIQYNIYIDT